MGKKDKEMLRMDSRKCQKQQEERARKQRFVLLPLWYGRGI
ncbi:hypothetical protein CLOSTHATH_06665 [Hungatella hathewayi DSM 13479]|uniref:Uncharacterized protein n=1 Tax=Hungatella hathewayi DSM 13479 TaxID=566550 RepID=D3ASQ7_9FIRM|nr:hypothetical protein CLOSTHATH_06665 [Hungatella hathewayi DSM 13479]